MGCAHEGYAALVALSSTRTQAPLRTGNPDGADSRAVAASVSAMRVEAPVALSKAYQTAR